jgi:hypothetical protein
LSKGIATATAPASGGEAVASQPAKGCSPAAKSSVDLTPPPEDQPQPQWAIESDTVEAPPLWRGAQAKFVFLAKNQGEGVLNIQLKGG